MAVLNDQQLNQLGAGMHYYGGVVENGPVQQLHSNYQAPKPGFFSQVGHSLGAIGSGIEHFLGGEYNKIAALPKAIGQVLPFGPLSVRQQSNKISSGIMANVHENTANMQLYRQGKISKAELDRRFAANNAEDAAAQKQQQALTHSIPSTKQIIQSGLSLAAIPFAFGKLGATAAEEAGPVTGAVEGTLSKVPGLRTALSAEAPSESLGATIAKAPLRYTFGAPSNITNLGTMAEQAAAGQGKNLAANIGLTATQGLEKGPIGSLVSLGGHAVHGIEHAVFNKPGAVINALKFKNGETVDNFLQSLSGKQLQKYTNIAKVAEQHYHDENTTARKLVSYQAAHSNEIGNMSAKDFLDQQAALAKSSNKAQNTITNLVRAAQNGDTNAHDQLLATFNHIPSQEEISRVGVGKFGQSEASDLISRLKAANPVERKNLVSQDIKDGLDYTKNPNVLSAVQQAITTNDTRAMADRINAITRTSEKGKGLGLKLDNGYFPILKPQGSAGFVKPSQAAELVQGKKAPLGQIGNVITKAGLSPKAVEPGELSAALKANVVQALKGTKGEGNEEYVYQRLQSVVGKTKTAFSMQQLTPNEIKNALGADYSIGDARKIKGAVLQAYAKLPTELTGLGGKIVNQAIRRIPAEAYYLRAEMPAKYEYNPFFYVKQLTKSGLVGLAESGGRWAPMSRDTEQVLESSGLFNKGLRDAGEADFFGSVGKSLNNRQISRLQKNIVGGMAEAMARAQGKKLSEVWQENGPLKQQIEAAVRVSLGYPKGGYLNSPLAKTLNIIIFPSRFDTKILIVAGHFMAKQAPVAQVEIIRHLAEAHAWANSPQGKKWQKDNADVLSVLAYFSPLSTIKNVDSFLHSGKIADLGSIGGLPIGVLTTILQNQGVKLPGALQQSEQTNPATGQPYVNKIPITDKARVQQGFTDLLSSLFSYPGKTVGLASKTNVVQGAIPALKPAPGSFKYELPNGQPAPPLSKTKSVDNTPKSVTSPVNLRRITLPQPKTVPSYSSLVKPKKPKKQSIKTVPKSLQLH